MGGAETWLILSHAFNMDGRAASQMITEKMPHLQARGIHPIIVSAVTGRKDPVLEHHQVLPLGPSGLRFDLRHVLRHRIRSRVGYRVGMGAISALLLPFYLAERTFIPLESQWSWLWPAYWTGARLVQRSRPALVYSAGSADPAHLAAACLRRRFGVPWLAEIEDPLLYEGWDKSRMARRWAQRIEAAICREAAVAVWYTEAALARARARHPELGSRGHCVLPGADPPAGPGRPYRRGERFVIAHFGSLSPTRNLEVFLTGVEALLAARPERARVLEVHVYGSRLDPVTREAVERLGRPEIVRVFGRLERDPVTGVSGHDQVLARMQGADALLLLHGTSPFCEEYIPSKCYEYLATGRPILGLTWRNPQLDELLRSAGHVAVSADAPAAVREALGALLERWERDALQDSGIPSPHTVAAAVERIYALTRSAVASRP
jgi:glycosyltransferase involved in cell wall biosynthesis